MLYTQYSTYHVDVLVYVGLEHGGVIMTIIIILSRTVRVNSKIEVIFFYFICLAAGLAVKPVFGKCLSW